jgi:plastocyanin domain-containing protein
MRTIAMLAFFATVSVACKNSDTSATPGPSSGPNAAPPAATMAPATSKVRVVADDKGYTPSSINVQRGQPVTLEFVRTSDDTCAKEVTFPALGINKPLPLNSPVDVPVPTDTSRTYAFACGMGMFKGQLVVQ